MSTIHIIHGFIGSGKTTFAKRLEQETGAKRFTPDEIIAKRYGRNLSIAEIREANLAVKGEIWKEIKELIRNDKDIIMDYGLWKKQQRDDTASKIQELGGEPVLYEVVCNPDIMKQRALQRKNNDDIAITSERYDMYHKRFEPMTEDEKRITIRTDISKSTM